MMKPSVRIAHPRRRTLTTLLLCALAAPAQSADEQSCPVAIVTDPRLATLLEADPDDPNIEISSDTGDLGRAGDAELKGNVQIRMGQRLLTADEARVDAEKRSVTILGRTEYLDPTIYVVGQGGSFSEGNGDFREANFTLVDGSGRGAARSAQLRNQTVLDLAGVRYTVCPPGREDWLIQADKISLDQESRLGTARNARLEFKGVPILYSPWISFPVGDQRKSGLLFPAFGSGGNTGTQIVVPWYWNIAPNYDATFTSRWFSSRGYRIDPEFRYLTERSRGGLELQYLPHDSERDDSRGLYEWRNVTRFEPRFRGLVDAGYVTDDAYFEDFGVGFEGTSIVFLNQFAELRRDTDTWTLIGRTQNYQVIDNALADDDRPYSLLPQVYAAGRWTDLPLGFGASLEAEGTNFYRELGPEGIRLDAQPALSWRAGRRGAYVEGNAAWRYTTYSLSNTEPGTDQSLSRSLPVASLDSGFVLERITGSKQQRVQTLEPRALYLYVPYRDQDAIPIFDTATPDLNMVELFRTNRYVGADRVGDANQVAVGVTSRLLDAQNGRQYLSATLGQQFYFEDPRVTLPGETPDDSSTSDLVAELELDAFKNWNARLAYQWDPSASQTERTEVGVQYQLANDSVLNAAYRYRRDLLEQFDVSGAWPVARDWHLFGRWVYSLSENKTLDQFVGFEYTSCCWALKLITRRFVSSRTGDSDTSVGIQLELKGLSSVGVDNETFLRDAIRGYSALPSEPSS
jgi:LPS-assembly protein